MSIYPTRTAAHLAVAGLALFGLGIAAREPLVVAWGGAVLVAIALARAVTLVSVMRIRAAGFEMLWSGVGRLKRVRCGETVTLLAEVRNRDSLSARYDGLRVVCSPALHTHVAQAAGEVPASGSVTLEVEVTALRVGYHGIYGLALEVRGAPGLFEVPLTFANPFGVEVMPRVLGKQLSMPQGGRSGTIAAAGRGGNQRGDGTELRELREHQPGDPFRRIAWKASAKRGQLVVKEFEREERDVVMLVLDASVELWSGPTGGAPLDRAIDMISSLASRHMRSGDLVGLRIVGARELVFVAPDSGRSQLNRIAGALMEYTGVLDADRSAWNEADMATQVTEHLRPLDPRALADLRHGRIDALVRRASAMRSQAPFTRHSPKGNSTRDAQLRHYAACFGLHVPARLDADRPQSAAALVAALMATAQQTKPRPSLVHVVAPSAPEMPEELPGVIRRLRNKRAVVRWSTPPLSPVLLASLLRDQDGRDAEVLDGVLVPLVERAVVTRAAVAQARGEAQLRRMGVKVVRLRQGQIRRVKRLPMSGTGAGSRSGRLPSAEEQVA